jgi:hypothetical protein
MEKFSPFEKLVGRKISDPMKETVLKHGEDIFNNQNFKGLENEKEKTAEELEMINIANDETNKLRQKYGLDKFDVPADNIHIVDEKDWGRDSSAVYIQILQTIGIEDTKNVPEKIWLMRKIFHEMLHFKSYNSFQLLDPDNDEIRNIKPYRCGLSVFTRDGKTRLLNSINEAVVEDLTKRFIKGLSDNPIFSEEIEQTKNIKEKYADWIMTGNNKTLSSDDDIISAKVVDTEVDGRRIKGVSSLNFTYKAQRKNLNTIITKIFYRNFGDFKDKEEIFDMFAKAVMTGNILPIGKLIDNTFGEGTIRKIGELDGCLDEEQEAFIDSL